ncbi:hypothetical protein M426DRAFT_323607 [Hypoxylon sp. CI-4A]|nr:hypothetical protein M426DRAFT_323607 [Hypoxylon sp. CI-4A]
MAPFSGKWILNRARSKLGHSHRLKGIIKKLSIKRLTNHSDDGEESNYAVEIDNDNDNDDQSSIGNPVTPTGPAIVITKSTDDTHAIDIVSRPSSSSTEQKKVTSLLLLPQELFDHITSYLGHSHIAVLALVNKELMRRFMTSCLRLDILEPFEPPSYRILNAFIRKSDSSRTKSRGTLLSLLDYDLQDMVYCYKCRKMHDPFVSFKDRAYAPHKALRCTDWSMDHHMPSRATRKMLRTITKRRIRGAEYRHLLQQVNNTHTTYQKGIMLQVSLRMRYRGDDMLLKRQQVITSIDKSALTTWLFGANLVEQPFSGVTVAPALPKTHTMCNHQFWGGVYSQMIQQWVDPLCTSDQSGEEEHHHTPACFSNEPFDISKQDGHMICERLKWLSSGAQHNPMDVPTLLGDVLGCTKCTTDFSLDVISLPEPFNWGFTMTTWLDLGKLDFCPKWDSHRDARPCREVKRENPHGDICEKFEDLPSRLDYRSHISEINLERMHNYGWSARAASGKDKYINWYSGHTCNPATGWIEDPDPLEDADY